MAESPESATASAGAAPERRTDEPRLRQVLMWTGIVAGVLFVVVVIFFSGFFLGRASGGHDGWHHRKGSANGCLMAPGGMMAPDHMGPRHTGPRQPPPTTPRP